MKPIKFLVPSFYKKFQCQNAKCPNNCCERGWHISINKNTYELYKKVKDPEFADGFSKYIKRNKKNTGHDNEYAMLVCENGICPFLEDGLCSVQRKLGYKYLSITCKIFPRETPYPTSKGIQAGLSMACRHVVRLAVLPTEPITFEEVELDVNKDIHAQIGVLRLNAEKEPLVKFFSEIQQLCIDIIQCRAVAIPDRLFVIGMVLRKLSECENINDGFEYAIRTVTALVAGEFNGITERFSDNQEAKATMKSLLVCSALDFKTEAFTAFNDYVRKCAADEGKNFDELQFLELNEYIEKNVALHWDEFLQHRSHIIENYLVAYMFGQRFPFTYAGNLSVYHHFIILAEQYALMRLVFSVQPQNEINDDSIIAALSEIYQAVSHGINTANLRKRYIEAGVDSLAHISFLLRK